MIAFTNLQYDYRIFREASTLVHAGHRVTVISTDFTCEPLIGWDGIRIILLPYSRQRSLRSLYPSFWLRCIRILLEQDADVYHAHDLDSLLPAAVAARRLRSKLIYDSHEFFTEQSSLVGRPLVRSFWRLLETSLISRADRVITVSQSIAQALSERYKLCSVFVVRNLPRYQKPVCSDVIRRKLSLSADTPVILYQGGFLHDNGLIEVVQSVAQTDNLALVLLGDGPYENLLRREVRRLALDKRVFFLPRVPFYQLHSYTCSADLGLCLIKDTGHSFLYSMPNKLFEYIMAGLPVLASDFPEMRQVILEANCGELCSPTNVKMISQLVTSLLNDQQRMETYREGSVLAARTLCWESEASRLLHVFEGL